MGLNIISIQIRPYTQGLRTFRERVVPCRRASNMQVMRKPGRKSKVLKGVKE
jgi:hypothetical protein